MIIVWQDPQQFSMIGVGLIFTETAHATPAPYPWLIGFESKPYWLIELKTKPYWLIELETRSRWDTEFKAK